jgi:Ca2+-binding RTX toxin-like protein
VISNGNDIIHCGTGTDTIGIEDAPDKIVGGAGTVFITNQDSSLSDTQSVWGGTGALTYSQAGGTLRFIAGEGTASIDGGAGALYINGGAGSLSVTGGSSGLHFVAGTGNASIDLTSGGGVVEFGARTTNVQEAGWGADDIFKCVAGHGGGTDTITGFRPGTDSLVFAGVHVASETINGGSTMLYLSDSTSVLLAGFADTGHMF